MAVGDTYHESMGNSVSVDLDYTVAKNQVAVVDGWLGVAADDGDSGDTIALTIEQVEYQFIFPAALSANKGDIVYIEVADLTGHTPDSTAYSTSAGSGKVALCRLTSALEAVTGGKLGTGIFLPGFAS